MHKSYLSKATQKNSRKNRQNFDYYIKLLIENENLIFFIMLYTSTSAIEMHNFGRKRNGRCPNIFISTSIFIRRLIKNSIMFLSYGRNTIKCFSLELFMRIYKCFSFSDVISLLPTSIGFKIAFINKMNFIQHQLP